MRSKDLNASSKYFQIAGNFCRFTLPDSLPYLLSNSKNYTVGTLLFNFNRMKCYLCLVLLDSCAIEGNGLQVYLLLHFQKYSNGWDHVETDRRLTQTEPLSAGVTHRQTDTQNERKKDRLTHSESQKMPKNKNWWVGCYNLS